MSAKLISVIGPPAAGKTTLAEYLATALPGELIREDYTGNPFLSESYIGDADSRLPNELYFLISRVRQLSAADWPSSGTFVSDYGFCQDPMFARLLLSEEDFRLYQRVAHRCERFVHPPDLLVCLDASAEVLLARIAERGREYEKTMTIEFLSAMRTEYDTLPAWATCPTVTIDTEAADIRDAEQCEKLLPTIREKL